MKYDFFSFCHFGVNQPFCYVVCEHLHNVDEGASYLTLFCYRPVSLLHFVAFFHVASLFSTGVDNKKVGVDNEKALELTNSTVFHRGRQ